MTQNTLTKAELSQFTGTEHWFRHPLARTVLYTDGVQYVAEKAGAYWLLDEIAVSQLLRPVTTQPFQLWRLSVSPDHTATLACEDGNGNACHTKRLTFTDFPLPEITFYCVDKVIMLPSEY